MLRRDREGCEAIQAKIEVEGEIEHLEEIWKQENRKKTRAKFLERHERNIDLEKKSGVKKEYKTIEGSAKKEASTKFYDGSDEVKP